VRILTNDIWNVEKLAEEEDLSPNMAKEEDGWGVMPGMGLGTPLSLTSTNKRLHTNALLSGLAGPFARA